MREGIEAMPWAPNRCGGNEQMKDVRKEGTHGRPQFKTAKLMKRFQVTLKGCRH
jgi:hypothetical protein